jgi:isocitrate dehydrogenase
MVNTQKVPVTVARGDGIGPEIMEATLLILQEAGAQLDYEFVDLGEKVFQRGIMNGIDPVAWESIRRTHLLLKSPITTPQGGGYKSVNVALRKAFGQFANVRPVRTFDGVVQSKHKAVDMVIVRENEESLYAGIEYRQTLDTCHSVKLYSRTGCELIIRYAYEYARANGRQKVTCLVKDNIMKITDGLFHKVFDAIGQEYPDLKKETLIVDIGMARIADTPERFDVVVAENLYGDIVSDIASQVAGSVGLAGSMNLGEGCAMFEAVHGSAPDITGKGIANPSGLLNGAILMLGHIGQGDVGARIGNALLATLENGQHTSDIAADKLKALSTMEFAKAVVKNLGKMPGKLQPFEGARAAVMLPKATETTVSTRTKRLTGVDVFVESAKADAQVLGKHLESCGTVELPLASLSSRGLLMYNPKNPLQKPEIEAATDLWMARFMGDEGALTHRDIAKILHNIQLMGLDWVKVENLYTFDHASGYAQLAGDA